MSLPSFSGAVAAQKLLAHLDEDRQSARPDELVLFKIPRLVRFLDANCGNVKDAAKQFREMLQWRRTSGIAATAQQLQRRPWCTGSVPGMSRLFDALRIDASGLSPEGDLIWVQTDKGTRFTEIARIRELSETLQAIMELRSVHLDRMSHRQGRLAKVINVQDMSGWRVTKLLTDGASISRLARMAQRNTVAHPETVRTTLLINVPAGFQAFYNLLDPFMDDRMRQKIQVCGDDFPWRVAACAGPEALETLAKLRGDVPKGARSLRLRAGENLYKGIWLKPGATAQWAFEVFPMCESLRFEVLFFGVGAGAGLREVVVPRGSVTGSVSGSFRPICPGLLWLSWANSGTWISKRRVGALELPEIVSLEEALAFESQGHHGCGPGSTAGTRCAKPALALPEQNLPVYMLCKQRLNARILTFLIALLVVFISAYGALQERVPAWHAACTVSAALLLLGACWRALPGWLEAD